VLEPFQLPFVQRGLYEVLLLSVGAGLLGTWIVLRGLAFYSHALATATFPGLVVADGLGFAPQLGAVGVALLFAGILAGLGSRRRGFYDSQTALILVAALALGVILASDVFHSGSNVDTLLFGSLLVLEPRDLVIAAGVSVLALAATLTLGRSWLVTGFDPEAARSLGVRSAAAELALLLLIALAAVAALSALGALLATALLVVPAATARLWTRRMGSWQIASVLLAAGEGSAGLWLSVKTNAPPGAAIAVLGGAVFALAAAFRLMPRAGRRVAVASAGLAICALASGCTGSGGSSGNVDVVATTTQIADFARQVGGNTVDVHQILQPNTDPHEYEPRPNDVIATANAAVVLENGDELDAWMSKVVSEAGGTPQVVDLSSGLPVKLPGETSGPEASQYDPHWWHDPVNAEAAIREIRDALIKAEPKSQAILRQNAAAYLDRLHRLDAGIRRCFVSVPPAQRKLVTSHDAFNYFAHRYDIRVVGAIIPSQTTEAQPSAGDISRLADQVRRQHVKAIFLESSINPKLGEAVAHETGAIGNLTLYGDTLGPSGSAGATYLGMEQANADAMMRGFTGGRRGCRIKGLQ
jgi:zinc/manganese transport system substrate-binding protein